MSCSGALSLDPPVCRTTAAGGVSKHKMINMCDRKLAFKVKSSNNSNYSVSKVVGFIDIGEKQDFVITRIKGPPRGDKMVFQFIQAGDATDAAKLFPADGTCPQAEVCGETLMKLSAGE
ncbi:unnamed protein product, partial [Mesorhabditis spiculigera]